MMAAEAELVPSLAVMVGELLLVLEHVVVVVVQPWLEVVGVGLHVQQQVGERLIFLFEAFYKTIMLIRISESNNL